MSADTVSIIKDVLVALTAIVVAGGAIYGLRTWKRELTGKAKFDVARNVMFYSFKLNEDFKYARSPFTNADEMAARLKGENESPDKAHWLDVWYARNIRLQPAYEDIRKMQEAAWEAEIVLGDEAGKLVSESVILLRKSLVELSVAIDVYHRTMLQESGRTFVNSDQDFLRRQEDIMWSRSDDKFSEGVEQAIDQLSSALKPYVR